MALIDRLQEACAYGQSKRIIRNESHWCDVVVERLGKDVEVSHGTISNYKVRLKERPDAVIGATALQALASVINVSANWLITGEGDMLAGGASPSAARTIDVPAHDPISDLFENELAELGDVTFTRAARAFCREVPRDLRARDAVMQTLGRRNAAPTGGMTEEDWAREMHNTYNAGRKMRGLMPAGSRQL